MVELLLKLIGVTDELLEHLDQATLAFQHPKLLWAGLVLLAPAGYFIYRRQQHNLATVPRGLRLVLSAT